MGKFFEALKKSKALSEKQFDEPEKQFDKPEESLDKTDKPFQKDIATENIVKSSKKKIDELRLDTRMPSKVKNKKSVPPFNTMDMDERLGLFLSQGSIAGECFKLLRAKILTKNKGTRPRSIMITSPQPMDGKTTVATNLAVNIAQGINEYVVLVDCDLRRPSLARTLGIRAEKGLREYLEEGTSVAPYLVKTSIDKLTLLPAGKTPSNPSELLSSDKMRDLVNELKTRYDDRYIIYDATPAQFGAETTFLASMLDSTILVVRSGKTNKDLAINAIDNIGRDKIFGVVMNASPDADEGYGYYYKYYQKERK